MPDHLHIPYFQSSKAESYAKLEVFLSLFAEINMKSIIANSQFWRDKSRGPSPHWRRISLSGDEAALAIPPNHMGMPAGLIVLQSPMHSLLSNYKIYIMND